MNDKFIFLLEELKENYSEQLFQDTLKYIKDEYNINTINENFQETKKAFNGQKDKFYDELAFDYVEDLNDFPEMYFMIWEPFFGLFDEQTRNYFDNSTLEFSQNTDAYYYINGFINLDNGNPEIALLHFNSIGHYVANYFKGICYLDTENYENSIKQNELFLTDLSAVIKNVNQIDLNSDPGILITKWNVYNDLGFAHNRLSEFKDAVKNYMETLSIFSLEENHRINHSIRVNEHLDEFLLFSNNYLFALEKIGDLDKCIDILNFIIEKYPYDLYYKSKLEDIKGKKENNEFAENIFNKIFKPKKPFSVGNFEATKILSKEKVLEDMIMEQIKYGFKVFDKSLEVYNDKNIFGRQYYIASVNGFLDLLLIDPKTKIVYVVELKRNEAGIEVVEQTQNYMKGMKNEISNEIRGIICLHKPKDDLIDLVNQKEDIELYTYNFDFSKVE